MGVSPTRDAWLPSTIINQIRAAQMTKNPKAGWKRSDILVCSLNINPMTIVNENINRHSDTSPLNLFNDVDKSPASPDAIVDAANVFMYASVILFVKPVYRYVLVWYTRVYEIMWKKREKVFWFGRRKFWNSTSVLEGSVLRAVILLNSFKQNMSRWRFLKYQQHSTLKVIFIPLLSTKSTFRPRSQRQQSVTGMEIWIIFNNRYDILKYVVGWIKCQNKTLNDDQNGKNHYYRYR